MRSFAPGAMPIAHSASSVTSIASCACEALVGPPRTGTRTRKRLGHLCIAKPFGTGEHDSTSQGEGLLALWPPCPAFKRVPLVVVELHLNCRSAPSCHVCLPSSPIEGQTRARTAKFLFQELFLSPRAGSVPR